MKRLLIIILCCCAASSCGRKAVEIPAAELVDGIDNTLSPAERMASHEPLADIFGLDSLRCEDGKVKNGQFFSTLLEKLGLTAREAYDLTQATDSVFDPRNLRVGNTYKAYYGEISPRASLGRDDNAVIPSASSPVIPSEVEESLQYLVYDQYRGSQIVFRCQPPYEAWVYDKPVTIEQRYADVTIENSLWVDFLELF